MFEDSDHKAIYWRREEDEDIHHEFTTDKEDSGSSNSWDNGYTEEEIERATEVGIR